jgi:hypothetical protein
VHSGNAPVVVIRSTKITTAIPDGTVTFIAVASTTVPGIATGNYVKIDGEIMRVTAVAGATLTVVRGEAATAATAHTADTTVTVIPKMTTITTSGGISAAATSFSVTSTAAVGAAAGVYLRIGEEIVRIHTVVGQVWVPYAV